MANLVAAGRLCDERGKLRVVSTIHDWPTGHQLTPTGVTQNPERPWYTPAFAARPGSSVVEQRTFNARAVGSIPTPVTSFA